MSLIKNPVVPATKDASGHYDFYSSSEYTPNNDYEESLIEAKLVQWEKGYNKAKEVGNIVLGNGEKATVYYYSPKDALCVLISVKWGKDFLARIDTADFDEDFQWLQGKDIADIRAKFEEAPVQIWKQRQEMLDKEAREPWQMTCKEYEKSVGAKGYWAETSAISDHKEFVRKALAAGKPVPADVLADYPELQTQTTNPTMPNTDLLNNPNIIIARPGAAAAQASKPTTNKEILDKITAQLKEMDYVLVQNKPTGEAWEYFKQGNQWQLYVADPAFGKFGGMPGQKSGKKPSSTPIFITELSKFIAENDTKIRKHFALETATAEPAPSSIVNRQSSIESPFSGNYFRSHPAKILGTALTHNPNTGRELTDAWGKPRTEVWGDMKDVLKGMAHVPDGKTFEHFVPVSSSQVAGLVPTIRDGSQPVAETIAEEGRKPLKRIYPPGQSPASQSAIRNPQSAIERSIRKTINESNAGGKCDQCTVTLEESIVKYNTNVGYKDANATGASGMERTYDITPDEIKVWITYQCRQSIYDADTIRRNAWGKYLVENPNWRAWHSAGLVAYDGRDYMPDSLYFAGNVYDRLRRANENQDAIVAEIGQDGFDRQVERLEAAKPKALLITEDPTRKLYLSPFHKIWEQVKITELANGRTLDSDYSIGTIFYKYYLESQPKEAFVKQRSQTTAWEIYQYWIEKANFPRGRYDESEKATIKRNTQLFGSELFDKFLVEMLTREDKAKIAALWNAQCNGWRDPEWHRIPVGFEVSKKFKGGELRFRPVQREGAAFLNHRGTGILGFDVGVGKTASCIITIEDGFNKGLFKRPMVVVPQKVIKKWIGETVGIYAEKDNPEKGWKKGDLIAEGILPHRKVVDYDNLGVGSIERARDKSGIAHTVPEMAITFVTYEALEKIGFNKDTEGDLVSRLKAMLSQGESGRAGAKVDQKSEEWIDDALKGTELDIEDMGIDAIFVDEAHNFRNLFMEVKGDVGSDGEREQKNFHSGSGSEPSGRAIKLFMLNTYLHDQHGNRNTYGLTATPFTNRATEIYSMLAMFDYEGLKDFDVYNIAQFCTNFIDETYEQAFTAKGTYENKAVIRGYNNLPTLQAIVFRAINYKTGEEVKIPRPEKVVIPLFNDEHGVPLTQEWVVETNLPPTGIQEQWLGHIRQFARHGTGPIATYYPKDAKGRIPGQILIALGAARTCTFTPYALKLKGVPMFPDMPTPTELVESSPKLKYVTECIKTVRAHHLATGTPVSGQVIYSDVGIEFFDHIRQYLMDFCGYGEKEVATFHGGTAKGRRENIKEGFLAGEIKIIIGSSTLREGVDLQTHCSAIYVCHLDWNPTDLHQLMGRGWRFGNKFSHIRIVVPLIENSSDPMTWQKLSEKIARLNSIWTKADGTKMFEEGELNPEELKKSLINDPVELAKYDIDEEAQAVLSQKALLAAGIKELGEAQKMNDDFQEVTNRLYSYVREAQTNPIGLSWDTKPEQIANLKKMEVDSDIRSVYRVCRAYSKLKSYGYPMANDVEQHIKQATRLQRLQETILDKNKLTFNDSFEPLVQEWTQKKEDLETELARLKSDANLEEKTLMYIAIKQA